jgi:hypothetical protein
MSTTLSVTSEQGLGAFRDITPGGLPASRENATWAAATLDGALYLAVASREAHSVHRYQTATGKWQSVYHKAIRSAKDEAPGAVPSVRFRSGHSPHKPALHLRIVTGETAEQLRSRADGNSFETVLADSEDAKVVFSNHNAVPSELPEHPASAQFSRALTLAGKNAVAFNDAVLGCSVWIQGETWQPALIRGAHRFSDNSDVLGAESWRDSLIFVLGKASQPTRGKSQQGFDIVRLYSDGSWDLLAGTPRVSNQGLKVPLACLGPGMNEFEPSRFCFLTAGRNHLLLGTYDDLAGFRIWRSIDGTDWKAGEAELVGIDRVRAAQPLRIAGGTALLLDLDSPQHGQTRAVWIGE